MVLPGILFDIRQAAFLINPLKKSTLLPDVIDYDGDDVGVIMAELWRLHDEQKEKLDALPKVKQIAEQIDFPLIPILARIEHRGIILDTKLLEKMNHELTQDIDAVRKKMVDLVGYEFNISSPAQLAEVLFTKLQLPTAGIKKGKTGFSTGQKELDKLRGLSPIIELIEQYRESKTNTPYIIMMLMIQNYFRSIL